MAGEDHAVGDDPLKLLVGLQQRIAERNDQHQDTMCKVLDMGKPPRRDAGGRCGGIGQHTAIDGKHQERVPWGILQTRMSR